MNFENNLAKGLVDEIMKVVYKYEETMTVATAVGCLEIAKLQLIENQMQDDEDE